MHLISEKQRARLAWFARRLAHWLVVLACPLLAPCFIFSASAQQPDNTKTNQQDRVTADQQGQNPADREITQKIRKALTDDKDLSTYAHNIKIITKSGVVRLLGLVRSEEEKAVIESKAVAIVGPQNVKDELTVKPKS